MAKENKAEKSGLSTGKIVLFSIIGILVLLALWVGGTYNSLVSSSEGVDGKWAQVETQYQRRFDLITNLVKTLKSQTTFEAQFITNITELNTRWQAGNLNQKIEAAGELDALVSRLLVAPPTNFPAITSAEGYTGLRDEWANTENKIAVERGRFNDAVRDYNIKVRAFPSNLVAAMFGFGQREYFEAAAGTESTAGLSDGLP